MTEQPPHKSTVDEIRERFDRDVERFSNLEKRPAGYDGCAALVLELITDAACAALPHARSVLDIGCGAGNYTLRLLEKAGPLDVTLVDLSLPCSSGPGSGLPNDRTAAWWPISATFANSTSRPSRRILSWRRPCCITCARMSSGKPCSKRCGPRCAPAAAFGSPILWPTMIPASSR